jgi:hypothetical protein
MNGNDDAFPLTFLDEYVMAAGNALKHPAALLNEANEILAGNFVSCRKRGQSLF